MLNINAVNFSETLSPNYQLPQLLTFLKDRLIACGIADVQVNEQLSLLGCTLKLSDNQKGTVRYILKVALNRIDEFLYASENYDLMQWKELKPNTGITFAITLSNVNPLTIYSIPIDNQIFGLNCLESGNIFRGFLGIAYATADKWYDENKWVLAGLLTPTTPNNFSIPVPNPQNSAIACRFKIEGFATRNPDNLAQILTAPYCTFHNFGIGARFNEEIGLSNNQGFSTTDISVDGANQYWNLFCGDNGVVIKCS